MNPPTKILIGVTNISIKLAPGIPTNKLHKKYKMFRCVHIIKDEHH